MVADVITAVKLIEGELINLRRDFHKYPENGWNEYRTCSIIAQKLTDLGYQVLVGEEVLQLDCRMGLPTAAQAAASLARAKQQGAQTEWLAKLQNGRTAVVGVLKGDLAGPTRAFRFDVDANDLTETQDARHLPVQQDFVSVNVGIMHACGHDGHIAMGLGLAKIVRQFKARLKGTVKIIFQPAEEGCRGAKAIAQSGILDDVTELFGTHLGLTLGEVGNVACQIVGFYATTKIDAYFTGQAAHAGLEPEKGKNALLAASCAALNLHALPRLGAGDSRVNVGVLMAGEGRNIVAPTAYLKLETRGASSAINALLQQQAYRVLTKAAEMYDTAVRIEEVGNDAAVTPDAIKDEIYQLLRQLPGLKNVYPVKESGASEDCTTLMEYVQHRGGRASFLGVGASITAGHHTDHFDIDEKALAIGVICNALIALR